MVRDLTAEESRYLASTFERLAEELPPGASLESMLEKWRRFVATLEGEYRHSVYDYQKELWNRDALEAIMVDAPGGLRRRWLTAVGPIDARYDRATLPASGALLVAPSTP